MTATPHNASSRQEHDSKSSTVSVFSRSLSLISTGSPMLTLQGCSIPTCFVNPDLSTFPPLCISLLHCYALTVPVQWTQPDLHNVMLPVPPCGRYKRWPLSQLLPSSLSHLCLPRPSQPAPQLSGMWLPPSRAWHWSAQLDQLLAKAACAS